MNDPILGRAFAHANGAEQGEMLNTMARELYVLCRGAERFQNQLYEIAKALSKDGESLIVELAQFIKLRREEMP